MLRSANFRELVEPRRRGKYTIHSFRVAASSVWNNLPGLLRNDDISREQFSCDLKTFLFVRAYSSKAPLRTVCLKVRFISGLTCLLTSHRSGVALATHHTLSGISTYGLATKKKRD